VASAVSASADWWQALTPPLRPSATLAWDASPDATVIGYKLYSGIVGGLQTNVLDAGSALTLTVSNLQAGATYFFFATAYNAEGIESEPSNVVLFSPTNRPAPIVWLSPGDIVYGTALSPAQLNATSSVPGAYAYDPPAGTVLNAGPAQVLSVVFTPSDTNACTEVVTNVVLNVLKSPLTISANGATKTYGEANPALSVCYSGFVNGDTAASLAAPARVSTTATAASPVGSYPITASGAASANYTISYLAGALSVTQLRGLTASGASVTLNAVQAPVTLIASASSEPGGSIQLAWTCAPGSNYQVLWKHTLNDSDWLPVSAIIQASESVTRWSRDSTNASGFYKIALVSD
jgi:hypothetical protein